MAAATQLHRKSLLRLIHGDLARKPRRPQRGKGYGSDVQQVVKQIAHSLDYPCAERLQPNLVWLGKHLAAHGELNLPAGLERKLETIHPVVKLQNVSPTHKGRPKAAMPNATPSRSDAFPGMKRCPDAWRLTWSSWWTQSCRTICPYPASHRCGYRLE